MSNLNRLFVSNFFYFLFKVIKHILKEAIKKYEKYNTLILHLKLYFLFGKYTVIIINIVIYNGLILIINFTLIMSYLFFLAFIFH
jgi:hypothetical protein